MREEAIAKTARDLGRALVLKSVKVRKAKEAAARKAKPVEREMARRTVKPRGA